MNQAELLAMTDEELLAHPGSRGARCELRRRALYRAAGLDPMTDDPERFSPWYMQTINVREPRTVRWERPGGPRWTVPDGTMFHK